MPIVTKEGYTLTKELLTQEIASIVQNGSITADKLDDGAVITSKLHDGAVTDDKCYSGFALVPRGGIIMWYGAIVDVPTGWAICDGTNGTPDLRNRFVVGAGSTYSVGGSGGSADAIVVSHTHTASVNDPGHSHQYIRDKDAGSITSHQYADSNAGYVNTTTSYTNISVSNSTVGSSGTNANLPPYYALAYIMRLV